MKTLLLILIISFSNLLIAQNQNNIEVAVGTSLSYFRFQSNKLSYGQLGNLYAMEDYKYNLIGDVQYTLFLNKNLFLKTGLVLNEYGYTFEGILENTDLKIKERKSYKFIGMPINVGVQKEYKLFDINYYTGISFNYIFFARERNMFLENNIIVEEQENQLLLPENWYLNSTIGSKVLVSMGKVSKASIGIEGNVLLTKIQENNFYNKNYYSIGLKLGILRTLNYDEK